MDQSSLSSQFVNLLAAFLLLIVVAPAVRKKRDEAFVEA